MRDGPLFGYGFTGSGALPGPLPAAIGAESTDLSTRELPSLFVAFTALRGQAYLLPARSKGTERQRRDLNKNHGTRPVAGRECPWDLPERPPPPDLSFQTEQKRESLFTSHLVEKERSQSPRQRGHVHRKLDP